MWSMRAMWACAGGSGGACFSDPLSLFAWRVAAMYPAISIILRIVPPCTLPAGLASSGSITRRYEAGAEAPWGADGADDA